MAVDIPYEIINLINKMIIKKYRDLKNVSLVKN